MKSKNENLTKTCDNVELEFTKRFLSLFSSLYETPSIEEIITFPPVDKINQPEDEIGSKLPPFHSGVWDFRLKKSLEQRIENDKELAKTLDKQIKNIQSITSEPISDIQAAFEPESAPIPEKPRYIQIIEKDKLIMERLLKEKHKRNALNILETEKIYSKKLKKQDEKTLERSKRRFMCIRQSEKDHFEFVNSFKKTEENNKTPKKIEENNKTPKKLEENNKTPKKLEENNKTSKKIEENNKTPKKIEENNKNFINIEENKKISKKLEEKNSIKKTPTKDLIRKK